MSTIDIASIPAERLRLLDTATLYEGAHPAGSPDCKHCARELLHEVVTGVHCDDTPEGVSTWVGILPELNDGPWRDDAHRTAVLRPYLPLMLALDPALDVARGYAVLDWACRVAIPQILDMLGATAEANGLRALPAIVNKETASSVADIALARARDLAVADIALARARDLTGALAGALARDLTLACARARDLAGALAGVLYRDLGRDLALARARDIASARDLAGALAGVLYRTSVSGSGIDQPSVWEEITKEVLDRICGVEAEAL